VSGACFSLWEILLTRASAIIFYAGNFFSLISDKPALLAGGLFSWFFAASFIPWVLIDTVGRRKLLLACISGMAMAFAIEAALVWKVEQDSSKVAAAIAAAVLFIYMGLFTVRLSHLSPCALS
jgi:hypothetical protein